MTSERLAQLFLSRIEAYNKQGPRLDAVIRVNPRALDDARALDTERKTKGPRGPLHGIPMLLKDNIDAVGLPTSAGFFERDTEFRYQIKQYLRSLPRPDLPKTHADIIKLPAMEHVEPQQRGGRMRQPGRTWLTRIAAALVVLACTTVPLAAQTNRNTGGKSWTVSRTPDGQPDLQGMWSNYDQTPFERLNPEEVAERGPAVSTQDWLVQDSPSSPRRPSMVVDPPDGRVPLKPEASARRDAAFALDSGSILKYGPWERCITRGVPGSMWPGAYNNGHQIIQTPGYVVLHSEMIHEARVIPLDGRPTLDAAAKSWDGDSRGRWEGDTLVIETTNFNGKGWLATNAASGRMRGIELSESAKVTERLTRVSEQTIQYQATIDDPTVYTRPWTVAFPLNRDDGYRIFEYACHEGNHALENMLKLGQNP